MTNTENRKSMDDVLASIRRIVRAEKDAHPEPAGANPGWPSGGYGGELSGKPGNGDAPLALTPEMRIDDGPEPEAIARPAEGTRAARFAGTSAAASPEVVGSALDREILRELLREILMEELATRPVDDAVRGIIRDELINGEIGSNISENVLRLLQSEIAKALEGER